MSIKVHRFLLIFSLIIIGLILFYYRHAVLGMPLKPSQEKHIWLLDTTINFSVPKGGATVNFILPGISPHYSILDENFVSGRFGLAISRQDGQRVANFTLRHAKGFHRLYYRAIVYNSQQKIDLSFLKKSNLTVYQFPKDLEPILQTFLAEVKEKSLDQSSLASALIQNVNAELDKNLKMFFKKKPDEKQRAEFITHLLSNLNLESKVISVIKLQNNLVTSDLKSWLIVKVDKQWAFFDPTNGEKGLPQDYLVWSYRDNPIVSLNNGKATHILFSVVKDSTNVSQLLAHRAENIKSSLMKFSLLSLPIKTQALYRVLFTIPIGALVILILRIFIGIPTFGTFMPVLIALAFRGTGLYFGLLLFILICILGLVVRFYLETLKLLLVPRLSAILTVVILIMMVLSLIMHQLGFDVSDSITLYPIVVLTMTIERICVMWEEQGAKSTLKTIVGSFIAATIAYLLMSDEYLTYLFFAFPETLLILLAIILWISQYKGYRLTELKRFKKLAMKND